MEEIGLGDVDWSASEVTVESGELEGRAGNEEVVQFGDADKAEVGLFFA